MMQGEQNHFVCLDCAAFQPQPGACGRCGSEPTLDARDPNVREMCTEQDTERRSKRDDRIRYLSIPFGVVSVIVACFTMPAVALLLGIIPFFLGYIAAMVGATLLVMFILKAAMPHRDRFPRTW